MPKKYMKAFFYELAPEGNVWKFRAFLITFPRMILRLSFVTYFVNALLILTLSTSKLVIVLNRITGLKSHCKISEKKRCFENTKGKEEIKNYRPESEGFFTQHHCFY